MQAIGRRNATNSWIIDVPKVHNVTGDLAENEKAGASESFPSLCIETDV